MAYKIQISKIYIKYNFQIFNTELKTITNNDKQNEPYCEYFKSTYVSRLYFLIV